MNFRTAFLLRGVGRNLTLGKNLLVALCLAVSIALLLQLLALENGMQAKLALLASDTGADVMMIAAEPLPVLPGRGQGNRRATTLRAADLTAIQHNAGEQVVRITPVVASSRRLEFRELALPVDVSGTLAAYAPLRHYTVEQGRFLQALDEEQTANVVVLGARVAETLFGERQEQVLSMAAVIGQQVLIGNIPFEVIGVLQAKGSTPTGMSQDDGAYIPLATALRKVFNIDYYDSLLLELADPLQSRQLQPLLEQLLRGNHGLAAMSANDFSIQTALSALMSAQSNQLMAAALFRGMVGLTLSMAGVGIVAITQLNMTEREQEFGLRRAVGATMSDILLLVLLEILLLAIGAAFTGVLLGMSLLYVLQQSTSWALLADVPIVVQAAIVAVVLSLLSALAPALRAAIRSPLAALNRL